MMNTCGLVKVELGLELITGEKNVYTYYLQKDNPILDVNNPIKDLSDYFIKPGNGTYYNRFKSELNGATVISLSVDEGDQVKEYKLPEVQLKRA